MKVWMLVIALLPGIAHAADGTCEAPIASCFSIHARLDAYNGTPTFRLWPIGSHRILGVYDDHGNAQPALSAAISDAMHSNAFGKSFYGDYRVCPMTKQAPGRMQMVCVQSVTHLTVRSQPR